MADRTIDIAYDTASGFTFEEDGVPLADGNITVDGHGTHEIRFARKEGQSWSFQSFSMALGVKANPNGGTASATVGAISGDSFAWTVGEGAVLLTDVQEVPQGAEHGYEYGFAIFSPGLGLVPFTAAIRNRNP